MVTALAIAVACGGFSFGIGFALGELVGTRETARELRKVARELNGGRQ